MLIRRRTFLGRAAGLAALGAAPPVFLSRTAAATDSAAHKKTGRALVVVELAGGNDGLNTVVPYADPAYRRNRPGVGIPENDVLKMDKGLGLHPRLKGFKQLYDEGLLAVVQGVGYPNPNRSHFRSMDIWQSARPDVEDTRDGWLGRALEARAGVGNTPAVSLGSDKLPLALASGKVAVPAIYSLDQFRIGVGEFGDREIRRKLMDQIAGGASAGDDELAFLRRTSTTAYHTADRLKAVNESYKPAATYPTTFLGNQLKLVAQMLAADLGTELFYVSLGGFDTHSQQANVHGSLLGELGDAVRAFVQDLRGHKLDDRVALMTYSEFGRRVKENGSLGTDHGAASQVFVVRPANHKAGKPGIHGRHPSLTDLDDGDLKFHTDFRSVYATMLDKWLGIDSSVVLGRKFDAKGFI